MYSHLRKTRQGILTSIIATLIVFCVAARSFAIEVGDTAPNWMLYNTQGEAVLLYEELPHSEKTVLFFWASWCQRCSDLLPQLDRLAKLNPSEEVQVFTLNLWDELDPQEHLNELGVTLKTLTKAETVALRYGVAGTPSMVVVDNARRVLDVKQAGELTAAELALVLHPHSESKH